MHRDGFIHAGVGVVPLRHAGVGVVPLRRSGSDGGGDVEELVDGYGCFGGGRVVEIEDESCINAGRSAGSEPARQVKSRCGNGGRGGAGAKTRGSE